MKRCTECNKEINAEEGSTYIGNFPKCRDCFSSNRSHRSGVRTQGASKSLQPPLNDNRLEPPLPSNNNRWEHVFDKRQMKRSEEIQPKSAGGTFVWKRSSSSSSSPSVPQSKSAGGTGAWKRSSTSSSSSSSFEKNANDAEFVELDNNEIVYFLKDMNHNLQWFLDKAAEHYERTGSNEKLNLTGEEDNSEIKSIISVGNNKYPNLFRTEIPWDSEKHTILQKQINSCSCKQGRIHIFKGYGGKTRCKNDPNCWNLHCRFQHPIRQYRKETYPNFSIGDKGKVLNNAVIVPYYKDTIDGVDEVYLFNVFELSKKHWAFVGGDVKFSEDKTLYDASVREWKEECGLLLGYSFEEAFNLNSSHFENWKISEGEIASNSGAYFTGRFLFVHASEKFYNETKNGVNNLLEKNLDQFVTSMDDKVKMKKIHTEGFTFLECDQCCWISFKGYDDDINPFQIGSKIRSDNVQFVRQRNGVKNKWWKWMCNELSLSFGDEKEDAYADVDAERSMK
jgi:hypothetical protein